MTETKTLKVYHIINPPTTDNPTYYGVYNIEGAVRMIRTLVQKDLKDPRIEMNIFGLEEYNPLSVVGMEWEEWYDEGGFDIQQIMDGESDYYDENGIERS